MENVLERAKNFVHQHYTISGNSLGRRVTDQAIRSADLLSLAQQFAEKFRTSQDADVKHVARQLAVVSLDSLICGNIGASKKVNRRFLKGILISILVICVFAWLSLLSVANGYFGLAAVLVVPILLNGIGIIRLIVGFLRFKMHKATSKKTLVRVHVAQHDLNVPGHDPESILRAFDSLNNDGYVIPSALYTLVKITG
jgi:hypothetical protein